MGYIGFIGYWFDPAAGHYQKIELDVSGDREYRNLSPSAGNLLTWLKSLDIECPIHP